MASPLRRGKLGDTAAAALILVAFSIVPFVLILTNRTRIITESLRTVYTTCLGLSWLLFLVGAVPLLYYWRKDRNVDREFLSTASPADLWAIFVATLAVAAGCIVLIAAEVVGLVDLLKGGLQWTVIIDAIAIALLLWISILVGRTALEVRAVRRDAIQGPLHSPAGENPSKMDTTGTTVTTA